MKGPVEHRLANAVVHWQAAHGRNTLPWQNTQDPYRVWLSEIMLQQTQVSTVLDYYPRFLARFPDVAALAAADADEVLALWSGLGYYSRARNLHACARQVVALHQGEFPRSAQMLQTLPGIGRSTAAAIAAFCYGERAAILDANVKRVLSRVLGFDADLAVPAYERDLWAQATDLLPRTSLSTAMPRYTQGLMDLGATVCLARKPRCMVCPLDSLCVARRDGDPERYPVRTRKLKRTAESWWLLLAVDEDQRVWLERRPARGIWAGLYCLPVSANRADLLQQLPGGAALMAQDLPVFLHVLTHKDLHLHPVRLDGITPADMALEEGAAGGWYAADQWQALGLPAPVRKLLEGQMQVPVPA